MKSFHPESKLYCCSICDVAFNCALDLSSHTSNLHQMKRIKYKHCTYQATLCVRMSLHVRIHTGGVRCVKCNKHYPSQWALRYHSKLHGMRQEFQCGSCDKVFVTASSLQIHLHGKHGVGFVCKCGQRYDSPAQRARHAKKCQG